MFDPTTSSLRILSPCLTGMSLDGIATERGRSVFFAGYCTLFLAYPTVKDAKVYFMADVPHLMKCARNHT